MNHLYEAVNFQTKGKKRSPRGLDLEHPLRLLRTPPDASHLVRWIFLPLSCSALLTCHMGAVSLPIALPLYYKPARL